MLVAEKKAAQYHSDLESIKSQNAEKDSGLKELQNKLENCQKEKVLFFSCCFLYYIIFYILYD